MNFEIRISSVSDKRGELSKRREEMSVVISRKVRGITDCNAFYFPLILP